MAEAILVPQQSHIQSQIMETHTQWEENESTSQCMDFGKEDEDIYISRGDRDTEKFIPYDKQLVLVTRDKVKSAFQRAGVSSRSIRNLMDFIFKVGARRLFLIVTYTFDTMLEVASKLEEMQLDHITDQVLPLLFRINASSKTWYAYSAENTEEEFNSFASWMKNKRVLFCTHQAQITAPVFNREPFQYRFSEARSLPYKTIDARPTNSGFFGEVSRVQIHIAHIPAMKTVTFPLRLPRWLNHLN